MQDNLKDVVASQRDTFELYDFDVELGWENISAKLSPRKRLSLTKMMGIAASILLLGFIGYMSMTFNHNNSTELSETESYYEQIINAKLIQVKNKVKDPILLADIEQLDQAFIELKQDLKDNIDSEEVIMAMMANYQLKLRILERILQEIEEDEKETDSTVGL